MTKAFTNKNVLVVGLGKSGRAACRLLLDQGARVTLADEQNKSELKEALKSFPSQVHLSLGKKKFSVGGYDLIVTSPGVPYQHPSLAEARRKKIPVWPELELGWRFVHPYKTVAVTGTNGKTTTTAMIGHILKSAKRPTLVGGNIGTPLSDLVSEINSKTFLVLEVSSYQLEAHHTFKPQVAVFLNLTPDHLARHKTMKGYAAAKARLLIHMDKNGAAIYNRNDKWCRWMVSKTRAKKIPFPSSELLRIGSQTPLPGAHNVENAMAAAGACQALGLSIEEIVRGLKSFTGVRHRIQLAGKKKGVLYINDSKATNVDSTRVALEAFNSPIVLLLGGEHKGSSYKPLTPLIKKRVKEIIAYGESQPIIVKDLKGTTELTRVPALPQAVSRASKIAKKGDVVLLSPACASFDQYNNYEERGDHFLNLVKRLPS